MSDRVRPQSANGLAGREVEMAMLRRELAVAQDSVRLVVISGASGVGKSALAAEAATEVRAAGGRTGGGKFNQFFSTASFAAPLEALQALCAMALTESDDRLRRLRMRLRDAIGPNIGLLLALVPLLGVLLDMTGEALDSGIVGPEQTDRLKLVLVEAFKAIATRGEPLLLLIDDVQWADASTLSLLRTLMLDTEAAGLALVVTCRSAALAHGQPFADWLAQLTASEPSHAHLALMPLSDEGTAALLANLLPGGVALPPEAVRRIQLAARGNPLHLIEAARALREARSGPATLSPTEASRAVTWLESSDNDIRTLLEERLRRLGEVESQVLTMVACSDAAIGLRRLSEMSGHGEQTVSDAVQRLMDAGLLSEQTQGAASKMHRHPAAVRIAHDQIQAATRTMAGDDAWKKTHRRMAEVWADSGSHDMRAGLHLAEAVDLLVHREERLEGLRLLVRAAEDARRSAAFEIALQCLALARSLRDEHAWELHFDEAFALELAWHRALSHLGRYEECDAVYAVLTATVRHPADLVEPTVNQMVILQGKSQLSAAIELGMGLLRRVAPDLAFDVLDGDLSGEWERFLAMVDEWPLEALAVAPPCDAATSALSVLLSRLADAGVGDPSGTTARCALSLLRLWKDKGFDESMLTATMYIGMHAVSMGQRRLQQRLGAFGMEVATRRASPAVRGSVQLGHSLTILPWHQPLENAGSMADMAFGHLKRSGNIEMASYAAAWSACVAVDTSPTLEQAEQTVGAFLRFAEKMNQMPAAACLAGYLGFTGRLRGRPVSTDSEATGYPYVDIHLFTYLALGDIVFGDSESLARHVERIDPLIAELETVYISVLASFAVCWSEVDRLASGRSSEPIDTARLDTRMKFLRAVADDMPANFAALHHLLDARRAAIEKRPLDAMERFDAAIVATGSASRPWQQALVLEQAARFCLTGSLRALGERLMHDAHRCHLAWGAGSKAQRLSNEFAFLAVDLDDMPRSSGAATTPRNPDRDALYLVSQALSSETDMARLVKRTLAIVTRLTGATGAWLLRRDEAGDWKPEGQTHPGERTPGTLVRYASRVLKPESIADLSSDARFAADPDAGRGPRSILVMPITDKGVAHSILLLENSNAAGFFTSAHVDTVQLIAGQLSVSLQNAQSFQTLEMRVTQRTEELQRTATALALRDRALESSSSGVHISELTPAGKVVVYVNPMLEAISGFKAAELIGSPIWKLFGPEPDQPGAHALQAAVEARRPASATVRCYRPDGSMFWNELSTSPFQSAQGAVYFVGVHMDVSERVRAAEEDRRRTDRLRAVFELSPDGFVVLDSSATIAIVNPAFCRMTGLVADDLLGRRLSEFEQALEAVSSPSGELIDRGAFANVLAGEPQADVDAGMGEHGWLLTIAGSAPRTLVRRVRHAHDGPETVIYFRDVTRELEVDRMKSEFLSLAAHELRTPMTSIYGFSELLVTGQMPREQQAGIHRIIHKQSTALISLVGQLLDLARINALQGANFVLRPTSLQSVAREVIGALRGIESSERIVDAMPGDDVMAMIDADQFHLAITNVLSNALKYSSAGPVDVEIANRRAPPGRSQAGLRVRDHGIGMSPDQLARLFERFYRVNPTFGATGTGLGSNIVRDIMAAHKGEVEVESELGVGTVVTLWLDTLVV